jgi:hypothetical protein
MSRTCFVIMPIGDQRIGEVTVTASELRQRYADLIKEALLKADPDLEVVRADDVALPGSITSDILARLMHSDLVVADVTYPNPNVFYELGLRHACRSGTIIIRDKTAPAIPFDIAHLRHIEYENSPTGLKQLATDLGQWVRAIVESPALPDSQFLELAKLTGYRFPDFGSQERAIESAQGEMIDALFHSPALLELYAKQPAGEPVDSAELVRAMAANPDASSTLFKAMVKSGQVSLNPAQGTGNRAARRRKK